MTHAPAPTTGAVVSEHTTASAIGAAILADGGNAVDALIGTVLAVGTLCPYHSCIGGGGFAIVHKGGEWDVVDFRSCAPVRPTTLLSGVLEWWGGSERGGEGWRGRKGRGCGGTEWANELTN